MNNPSDIEIDVEEQREWLKEHRNNSGLSWSQLATQTGVPSGTLSPFANSKYFGRNDEVARKIFRYRQTIVQQAQLRVEAPEIPSYFETRTARELMNLLAWAQRGRLTFCAGGPGIGKTTAAREYRDRAANVWLITCSPAMKSVTALLHSTLRAMNDPASRASMSEMSHYLLKKLQGAKGLLIFDDAQHLSIDQVEEIRGWYDQTSTGVALLGNEQVAARMEGGYRRAAFAQLYSRVGMRLIRPLPLIDDIEALAAEWQIGEEAIVVYLKDVGRKPGGLRSCTFALEIGSMIARSENSPLTLHHLQSAWMQLNSRAVAA